MNEANRKLLEFAEFKFRTLADLKSQYRHEANLAWVYPTGEINHQAPDFFHPELGLGWLFKYVVPKVADLFSITFNIQDGIAELYFYAGNHIFGSGKHEAEALANAILKWLESEKE